MQNTDSNVFDRIRMCGIHEILISYRSFIGIIFIGFTSFPFALMIHKYAPKKIITAEFLRYVPGERYIDKQLNFFTGNVVNNNSDCPFNR